MVLTSLTKALFAIWPLDYNTDIEQRANRSDNTGIGQRADRSDNTGIEQRADRSDNTGIEQRADRSNNTNVVKLKKIRKGAAAVCLLLALSVLTAVSIYVKSSNDDKG